MTLEERRQANVGKQVDNASLPAGSNMYYYCKCCGVQTAVKPEGWFTDPPPRFCKPCLERPEDERTSYDSWLRKHNHSPVPS
jgi:hypothetical protein